MATLSQWIAGARPRTLPAAVAPVVVGTAAAHPARPGEPRARLLALLVSLGLQVGVNYANDYSDGIRGTDGPGRSGAARRAAPRQRGHVKLLAFAFFGLPGSSAWPSSRSARRGSCCRSGRWPSSRPGTTPAGQPYGYRGLGEVYVFVFFGLMATLGTLYTQAEGSPGSASRAPSGSGRWPLRSSWSTTCATSPPTAERQADARGSARRPAHALVLRRARPRGGALVVVVAPAYPWRCWACWPSACSGSPCRRCAPGRRGATSSRCSRPPGSSRSRMPSLALGITASLSPWVDRSR